MKKILLFLAVAIMASCADRAEIEKCDCYEQAYYRSAVYNANSVPTHSQVTPWVANPPGEINPALTCEDEGKELLLKTYFHHMYPDGSLAITEVKTVIECY